MVNKPKQRQEWIFEQLKVKNLNYVETLAIYGQTWAKSKTTFDKDWNNANSRYLEYRKKAEKAKEDISISKEIKALESGLKSKIERQAKIQKQIEDLEYELSAGIMITHTFVEGQLIEGRRAMNGLERSQIHRTIKELHSELSKMAGDYAPIKQASTDVDGNNVPPPIVLQPIQVNQLIMSDTTDVPLIEGEENSEHI